MSKMAPKNLTLKFYGQVDFNNTMNAVIDLEQTAGIKVKRVGVRKGANKTGTFYGAFFNDSADNNQKRLEAIAKLFPGSGTEFSVIHDYSKQSDMGIVEIICNPT